MGYSKVFHGSQAYANESSSCQGQQFPVTTTAGSSIDNPYSLDDGANHPSGQTMQRLSTNQHRTKSYNMNNPNLQQYSQQYKHSQLQLQNGQKEPAMSNQMTGYLNEQTQNVRGGFNNPARIGLGQAGQFKTPGRVLQNFYTQTYQQNGPQGPAQAHTSYGLPNVNGPSSYGNIGGNFLAGYPGANHGLPTVPNPVSGNNMYTPSGPPSFRQSHSGAHSNQIMMGNISGMTGMGRNNINFTASSHPPGTPRKPSNVQYIPQLSSSEPTLALDEFDFNDEERAFPEHHLLGAAGNLRNTSTPTSQTELNHQNGEKRKRQEEDDVNIQESSQAGQRSNSNHQTNQAKRQKQNCHGATVVGGSGGQDQNNQATFHSAIMNAAFHGGNAGQTPQQQTLKSQNLVPTSTPKSQALPAQSSTAAAGTVGAVRFINVGFAEQGYNDKVRQYLRRHRQTHELLHDAQSLRVRHEEFLQDLRSAQQNQLNDIQEICANMYKEQLRRLSLSSPTNPGTYFETSKAQLGGNLTQGSRPTGMPDSRLSYAEQMEQFRRLQEKVPTVNNVGSARAMTSQPNQQAAQQNVGAIMNDRSAGLSPRSSTNGTGINPQTLPAMDRADIPTPQTARVAGHKFDAPPSSQPPPNMNRTTITSSQHSGISESGAATGIKPHLPENFDRSMSAPQQTQLNGFKVSGIQNMGGYLPQPNLSRSKAVSESTATQRSANPAGLNTVQVGNSQLSSAPMQKDTFLPDLKIQTSVNPPNSASMQLSATQHAQGHSTNHGVQASNGRHPPVVTSKTSTPISTHGSYQSPYLSSASVVSISKAAAAPQSARDQSLHRAVGSAVSGGTSAPTQVSSTKTPCRGPKSAIDSCQTSSPPTVSPSSGSEGSSIDISTNGSIPAGNEHVNLVQVVAAVFHEHFTFPSESEGWKVTLNTIDEKYSLVKGDNHILLVVPEFRGGVTWPTMSNEVATSSGAKKTASKPRRKAPAKKAAPSSAATTSNATPVPTKPSSQPRASTATIPVPIHEPLRPGQKPHPNWGSDIPTIPQPPLQPGAKPPVTSSTPKASAQLQPVTPVNVQKKPDFHLDLKDVSPKASMRKTGPLEKQTEAGFPKLFTESTDDAIGDLDGVDEDDLFGDGEVFYQGNNDDQVSDPPASVNLGDETSKSLSDPTLPSPTVPSPSAVPPLSDSPGTTVSSSSPQAPVDNTQQEREKQSQPADRESLASILSIPTNTQQPSNTDQASSESDSHQVHLEDPKPAEDDISTSDLEEEEDFDYNNPSSSDGFEVPGACPFSDLFRDWPV